MDASNVSRYTGNFFSWIRNREFSVLVVLFLIVLALWGFVELADEVMEGETAGFDERLLLSMRTPGEVENPVGPPWIEEIGRDITALGGNAFLTLLTAAAFGFLLLDGKKRIAMVLLFATLGALAVSTVLKSTIDRDRPQLVPHHSAVYTQSFPSGHSMLSASTYLTMGALLARVQRRRRIKIYLLSIAVILTVMVGISRVYLGVHWPTDVMAGWTAGAAWAMLSWLLARWLQSRGQVEYADDRMYEEPVSRQ